MKVIELTTKERFFRVGEGDVISITEHPAQGEGDKWYYDVSYKDRPVSREFDFSRVLLVADDEYHKYISKESK